MWTSLRDRLRSAILTVLCLLFPVAATAADDGIFARLMKVKSLKCKFTTGAFVEWKTGAPRMTNDTAGLEYHFDSINLSKNSARLIANVGAGDVQVFATAGGLSFVEWPSLGNPVTTTVFPSLASGGGFTAVTSRHTVTLLGAPLPGQYHGTCLKWE